MKCGKPRIADGGPCEQTVPCCWHPDGLTEQEAQAHRSAIASRGGLTRMRVLPDSTPRPDLRDVKGIRKELTSLIHDVKVGRLGPEPAKVAILGLGVAVKLGELELHGLITDLERRVAKRIPRGLA